VPGNKGSGDQQCNYESHPSRLSSRAHSNHLSARWGDT
jgi:hypothetical protein